MSYISVGMKGSETSNGCASQRGSAGSYYSDTQGGIRKGLEQIIQGMDLKGLDHMLVRAQLRVLQTGPLRVRGVVQPGK
jgi:hypothetical protein